MHTSITDIQGTLAKGVVYVDKKMAEMNVLYADFRARNMIGPPIVSEVNTGTFDTVIDTLKKRSLVTKINVNSKCLTLQMILILFKR